MKGGWRNGAGLAPRALLYVQAPAVGKGVREQSLTAEVLASWPNDDSQEVRSDGSWTMDKRLAARIVCSTSS